MNQDIVDIFLQSPQNAHQILGSSLEQFITFFHWYMTHQDFVFMPFHREIIRKLEDIAFGRNTKRNLLINIMPRAGKSAMMKYMCAWSFMINPQSNCIYTSYSDDLVSNFSKDIRAIIESPAFKAFTGIKLDRSKTGADYWATEQGGGFRAAPLGGSLTGFGFGITGNDFGGVCLPYNEVVWTNKGKKRIGEIVSKKLDVKVLSYNFQFKRYEYKPIKNHIKNGESDILRVGLSNGSYIECTPDHKIWTENRGYVEALSLRNDDILLCPSNSFNLLIGKSNFAHNILSCVSFIKDKIHFLFREGSFLLARVINTICPPLKRPSLFYVNDSSITNAIRTGNFCNGSSIKTNRNDIFFGEFRTRKHKSSKFNCISHIFRLCAISKIFKPVVCFVAVKMPNFHSSWSFTNKSKKNRPVRINVLKLSIYKSCCKKIATRIFSKFENLAPYLHHFSISLIKNLVGLAFQPSKIRNGIMTSSGYCSPLFIRKIRHNKHSYCLTIRDNYNMVVGKSQGLLVSNCLIDDPLKASNVKSQAEMQNCIDYYLNTLKSRANNQAKSPMICIMQRLALEDLAGFIMENESEDWDIIKLPALNESTGEALWPEKFSAQDLLKLKTLSPFVYYGQYQQEPIVVGGSVIKSEWFRYYNPKEHYDYQSAFVTSDTAQKKGEANDFTVMCLWAKTFDEHLHLIDMVRGKFDAAELKEQVMLFWSKCKSWNKECPPYGFYIEDKSSGIGVIQELTKSFPIPIIPIVRARHKNDDGNWINVDKFSRCMTSIPYIANGWVYLPNNEKDDISDSMLSECVAFKADLSHKHDDQTDCLFDAIDVAFGDSGLSSVFI